MQHRPQQPPRAPADDEQAAVVTTLARGLDATLADEPWGRQPLVLVGLEASGGGLAPDHPDPLDVDTGRRGVDALIGFRAPTSWRGLIVVAEGLATAIDDPPPSRPRRVRVVYLLAASGACASLVRLVGSDLVVDDGCGEVVGRLSDSCHRVLGLPTPPPPETTSGLWAALWLDRVMRRVTDEPGWSPPWAEVEALHPAFDLAFDAAASAGNLPAAARRLAAEQGWTELRRDAIAGRRSVGPDLADAAWWFDDGSYARHLLSALPSSEELVDDLSLLLPQRLVERIVATLTSSGVPTRCEAD